MTRKDLFDRLAEAQRGEPEEAMHRIQHSQISQLYGYLAEHVGDLTHRMSEYSEHPDYKHGYPYVHEKIEKTLRRLRHIYGFEKEVLEQAQQNHAYYQSIGKLPSFFQTPEAGLRHLKTLGKAYADAHRMLPVVNKMQEAAMEAAIAVGEWRFGDAERILGWLEDILEKGPEAWAQEAGKVLPQVSP